MENNLGYLYAAYTVFWVLLSGYIYSISRRQSRVEQEIEALREN